MAEKGRGKRIPKETRQQMLELYCLRREPDEFLYSIAEIASIVDCDRKTVGKIVREESVRAMTKWPHPDVDI